ncbi:hypothetical protein O6H91_01G095700 [Diphasiastrum complanatum]|uniref:Uncharacterized protein n=1 Tax=Diphasiastrum complanatum TaxID=34168 RepID=A0ACC2ETR0_DIPCM|nr:hypothetical protein O6H91_01G095700 [Diphasiastrum complanatum]
MGNYMVCASNPNTNIQAPKDNSNSSNRVKVVLPNGTVDEFQTPLFVAELMLENPLCFVFESNSSDVPCRAAAMPADASLELGQLYFLLPAHALQSRNHIPCSYGTSFDRYTSVQEIVSTPENLEQTKQHEIAGKQVKLTLESWLNLIEKSDESSLPGSNDACFINLQLQMAYQRYLIMRNKLWKPKLESIGETGLHIQ